MGDNKVRVKMLGLTPENNPSGFYVQSQIGEGIRSLQPQIMSEPEALVGILSAALGIR